MKKLLGSVLALALLLPSGQANAELFKNLKLSGQVDLQTQASRNVTDFVTRPNTASFQADAGAAAGTVNYMDFNDRLNDAHTRVMVSMDWDVLDDVHATVTLRKNDRTWGTTGVAGQGAGGSQGVINTGGANRDVFSNVYVDQANFKVSKAFDWFDFTIGRQYYGESGDVVIYFGPSDKALYGQPVTALDIARLDWKMADMMDMRVTGIAGKATGSTLATVIPATLGTGALTRDVDIRGLTVDVKPIEGLWTGAYIYNRVTHANGALGHATDSGVGAGAARSQTPGLNDNLYVYGVKAKWEGWGFTVKGEFMKNGGENRQLRIRDLDGDGNPFDDDVNQDGIVNQLDAAADANYSGSAFKADLAWKGEMEGVGSAMPWFNFSWGSGREKLSDNRNEDFFSIAGDFRPGTIYGRFAPAGLVTLGQNIPCRQGGAAGTGTRNPICSGANAAGLGTMSVLNHEGSARGGVSGNGLTNRVIWGLGVKMTPAFLNRLTMGVSFWQFRYQADTDYTVGLYNDLTAANTRVVNGQGATGRNNRGNGNKHIGDELNIDWWWKHSDNVGLQWGIAGFRPGKFIQNVVEDARTGAAGAQALGGTDAATSPGINPVAMAYADLRIKF